MVSINDSSLSHILEQLPTGSGDSKGNTYVSEPSTATVATVEAHTADAARTLDWLMQDDIEAKEPSVTQKGDYGLASMQSYRVQPLEMLNIFSMICTARGYEPILSAGNSAMIGSGGEGAVFHARDKKGKDHAIKISYMSFRKDLVGVMSSVLRQGRFMRSVGIDSGLPSVMKCGVVWRRDGEFAVPYIDMEYVQEPCLEKTIHSSGSLDFAEGTRLGVALTGAVSELHTRGGYHGDVKPRNVRYRKGQGSVRLLDPRGRYDDGKAHLTPAYAAPETLERMRKGAPIPEASSPELIDVYGVAATLYQAFTGRLPFGDHKQDGGFDTLLGKMRDGGITPISFLHQGFPGDVDAAVLAGLAPNPANRISLGDLRDELVSYARHLKLEGIH